MNQDLYKRNYIKQLCDKYDLRPSTNYGQNFLITHNPIEKMLVAADIRQNDFVVEVGPGLGELTFELASRAKKVIAFEIERRLTPYWEEQSVDNLEIVWGDVLKELPRKQLPEKYKLVGNLPYQITSHLLRTIFELDNRPDSMAIMVQEEVADRICASKGEMSILALSVQYYGKPEFVSKISAGCFWPQPKVDSAIIRIDSIQKNIDLEKTAQFFKLVRAGFANKRKQLWRNLFSAFGNNAFEVKKLIEQVSGNEKIRAEELSLAQWHELNSLWMKDGA